MLTKEDFEALPEKAQAAFVLDGEEYVPVKDAKLKQTLNDVDNKYKELQKQLSTYEEQKKQEIEEARNKAMEEARSKGDVKAIEERYQQQMADLEKRVREEAKSEAMKEFKTGQAELSANALADKIGLTLGVDTESGELIADAIRKRIKIDPETGEKIFHDAKGSALSIKEDEFIKEVAAEKRFARLVKADLATTGGGNAKGSTGGSASVKQMRREQFQAMAPAQQMKFVKDGGKLI